MTTALHETETLPVASHRGLLWITLAAFMLLFTGGVYNVTAAAWLAPLFLMRYLRARPVFRGLLVGYTVMFAAQLFVWRGAIPVPSAGLSVVVTFGVSAILFSPFVVDRLVAHRLRGFSSTLVFPTSWVAMEYLNASLSPYATMGAVAYTQFDNLALLQIVSITGIYGVTFLIGWFAATVNWAWEHQFNWSRLRSGSVLYISVLAIVFAFGSTRLAIFPSMAETVRIASVTVERNRQDTPGLREGGVFGSSIDPDRIEDLRTYMLDQFDELFALTRREAEAGAKLVFWAEMSGLVFSDDEPQIIARGQAMARDEGIYLLMALWTVTTGESKAENKVVAIDPTGEILTTYFKAQPVPGEPSVAGDGVVPVLGTPFGRVAMTICYDMDFPALIRQAGHKDVDIMIVPARDWKEIDPFHTHMALVRGIENGMAVVRQVHTGWSAAADHQGNLLAAMDHFTTLGDRVMVAQVPRHGVTTLYGKVGNVFAWACLVALGLLLLGSLNAMRSNAKQS